MASSGMGQHAVFRFGMLSHRSSGKSVVKAVTSNTNLKGAQP